MTSLTLTSKVRDGKYLVYLLNVYVTVDLLVEMNSLLVLADVVSQKTRCQLFPISLPKYIDRFSEFFHLNCEQNCVQTVLIICNKMIINLLLHELSEKKSA